MPALPSHGGEFIFVLSIPEGKVPPRGAGDHVVVEGVTEFAFWNKKTPAWGITINSNITEQELFNPNIGTTSCRTRRINRYSDIRFRNRDGSI